MMKIQTTAKDFLPEYKTDGAAGADLRSIIECEVPAGKTRLIPTGIRMAIPSGYEAQIRPRSGLALKYDITIPNAPGTIDSDYREEIGVILHNFGEHDFMIEKGDRIAQMVIAKCLTATFERVDILDETERTGGFGSSGIK